MADPARPNHGEPLPAGALRAVAGKASAKEGIDPLVHDKVRLSILSALAVEDRVPFVTLKEILGASDGNLSVHARKLEDGKLIRLRKSGSGATSRTEYSITARGRRALEAYLRHLEEVIAAVRRAQ